MRERRLTVVISGELDALAVPTLTGAMAEITEGRPERLAFDLAAVSFMDCAAARLIVHAGAQLPGGERTVIRSATPAVRRLLALTGLDASCEFEA